MAADNEYELIRERVMWRDDGFCAICRGQATRVMRVADGNDASKFASVCDVCCHYLVFDESGAKRKFLDMQQMFLDASILS